MNIFAYHDLQYVSIAIIAVAIGLGTLLLFLRERRIRMKIRGRYLLRSRRLTRMLRIVQLSEELADIGHWELDLRTGKQTWSRGLFRLFGLDQAAELCPDEAASLFVDGEDGLLSALGANRHNRETYCIDVPVKRIDGAGRTFRLHACNIFGWRGRATRTVGVVIDVSEQVQRDRELHDRKRKLDEARHLAETDSLTGLANRRRAMEWLELAMANCRTNRKQISLIVLDIDHFKAVNDGYGHPAGDCVLKRVAAIVGDEARACDLIGRIGGEEFVIGLEGAGEREVKAIAERIRLAVVERSGTDVLPPVTASMGFATAADEDTSLSLFARADAALYAAKHAGRNRVRQAA